MARSDRVAVDGKKLLRKHGRLSRAKYGGDKMRSLIFLAIFVGVISHWTVNAQTSGMAPDFSGIYVSGAPIGTTTYTQPAAYPFTSQGQRAHTAFDPIVADPQQLDDCAGEP